MAKLTWNNFKKTHGNHLCFVASVSSDLPKGLKFDKKGLKLPTPYGLFCEWLAKSLSGDWSSMKVPGGFVVSVSSQSDASIITKYFPAIGKARKTPACPKTEQINYRNEDYKKLSESLGYVL
jgi:hypothetical protein